MVFEQLEEVLAEGHKALVFSQFTGLLDLVRKRLDAKMIPYANSTARRATAPHALSVFRLSPKCRYF